MSVELRHTWTFRRDSRIIRFYLWLWGTSVYQITFCKLFWAYVFAPVALVARFLWLLLTPVRVVLLRVHESDKRRAAERKAKPPEPKEEVPGRIAEFFARERPRKVAKVVGFVLLAVAGLAVVGGLGWSIYMLVTVWFANGVRWFLHTDAWLVATMVVGYFVAAVVLSFIIRKLEPRRKARRKRKHEAGEPTLGDVFIEGAKAVKSNTCPRIEVRP